MKTKILTVRFEVSDDLSADDLHEWLCLAIHEEDEGAISNLQAQVSDIRSDAAPNAYLQFADGDEKTLRVTSPDPDDGSYVVHLSDNRWVRLVSEAV